MQLNGFNIRYWFHTITPCLKEKDTPSHKQVDNTESFYQGREEPSLYGFLFSLLSWLICMSRPWAARTDRLQNQTRELPSRHLLTDQLEGRWFSCLVWAVTRWEAHGSPESSARCLSAPAGQKSFLLTYPYSRLYLHTLIVYLFPAWDTSFINFMCFPSLKLISAANSLQQSGFLPNVQGNLG